MALTTNQGLILPDGTDNANVPLSFTDYNSLLENRLVQRYLSIADRTARNGAPNEGELSYLADLNRFDYYQPVLGWVQLIPAYAFQADGPLFTTTSTVYTTVGAPLVGQTLIAPPSGVLRVGWASYVDNNNAAQQSLIGPQLNAGAVIGAGATVVAVNDGVTARALGTNAVQSSSFFRYTGLTPGNPYNVFLLHRTTGATASFANRVIELEQK
jgi:hypothetical protein